eukprot:snap_masked-scaffold_16-processed-gene-0.6-mRNA-1 protein AED:1.00 eAED:1.00 QI:0/-1/0/0/-1/1/1/0/72
MNTKELDKFVKDANPVIFNVEEDDGFELEEIDEGANLGNSKEVDMENMKKLIKEAFERMDLSLFNNSLMYKE